MEWSQCPYSSSNSIFAKRSCSILLCVTWCSFSLLVEIVALGRTFLKSLRKSQTIQELDEDQSKERIFHEEPKGEAVMFSRDSLEPEGWPFTLKYCSLWQIWSDYWGICPLTSLFLMLLNFFLVWSTDSLMIGVSAQSASALGLQTLNEEGQASFLANKPATEDSSLNKDQESFSLGLVSPQRCCKKSVGKNNGITWFKLVM